MAEIYVFMKVCLLVMWVQLLWFSAPSVAVVPLPPLPPLIPFPHSPPPPLAPNPPPPPPPVKPKRVRCRSIAYKHCFLIWQFCPLQCPTSCQVDCATCKPVCSCNFPGAVCQDPRFVGGDGITFYFHGRKDEDFCLVSDTNFHINAHFIGKRNPTLKRDFTWVQSIGVIFDSHKLLIAAKKTSMWNDKIDRLSLAFDNKSIFVPAIEGAKWWSPNTPRVSLTRIQDANGVLVEVDGKFRVTAMVVPITAQESRVHGYNISNEDCFAHLELGFKFYNLSGVVDGVLGQTYRNNYVSKANIKAQMPVLGGLHKFSSSHIFSTDCQASKFDQKAALESNIDEYWSVQCSSGMKGNGVVC